MRPYRLSIAGLLLLILAAGIGLAALCRPSSLAANAIYSLLLLSLGVAFIGVLYRREQARAFWTGFLASGSLYAVISLAPWFSENVGHRLVTTAILDILYPHVPPLTDTYPRIPLFGDPTDFTNDQWRLWTGRPPDYSRLHQHAGIGVNTTDSFLLIGHSLFAMIVATGGGLLARHFHEPHTRDSADADARNPLAADPLVTIPAGAVATGSGSIPTAMIAD